MIFKSEQEALTLVYGLNLFVGKAPALGEHPRVTVTLPDGRKGELTLHTISGGKEEIRARLLESIDAFFELIEPSAGERLPD